MGRWKREVRERFDKLERGLEKNKEFREFVSLLMNERKELLDRLMAVDFQSYKTFVFDSGTGPRKEPPLDSYEELAGEGIEMGSEES